MIAAAVLAAGSGKRIGTPKVLLRYNRKSFLEHILTNLRRAGLNHIFVVVGKEFDHIKKTIASKYPYVYIQNPQPENGPLSSFKLALEKMPQQTTGALLILVDHPLVNEKTYRTLKSLAEKQSDMIIIPVFKGKNGHPVYFSRKFFQQLLEAPLTEGARYVVRNNPDVIQKFESDDPGVIADIDTKEDFDFYIKEN
jgi:molybdenum cofactor cytidylyltransferase